ncbi:NADH-quinone oxidoreductase subunit J [Ruficoccus amylovorans]|uniref:NADH-quinone oxidoreductase subunit J n=1 Tax=Ruficoccus amylovorans TaxID=1804625 RepID=A0A842HH31_9BACT|nr:NADH-quinone oxidoreductase subunit J [Ruficoccus amylovorans]MBC2595833.1 NADH-quinone oxidoreductase subunit J [Ruficoccus amylovorans]
MHDFFFYLFSALTVLAALLVVINPDAVNSAVFMIVSFVGTAALFLLLDAFFLAILQVLVYAGAVMVLFLFIIMLLDVERSSRLRPDTISVVASVVATLLLIFGMAYLFLTGPDATATALAAAPDVPGAANPMGYATASRAFGYGLFTKYMLPFQVSGILLLVAMIGVIVLSKRLGGPGSGAPSASEIRKAEVRES